MVGIEQILVFMGQIPAIKEYNQDERLLDEVIDVYTQIYTVGLVNFFESRWWTFPDAKNNPLRKDRQTVNLFASFLSAAAVQGSGFDAHANALEARLVWQLICLSYSLPKQDNAKRTTLPPANDGIEARNRVRVAEALISGEYIEVNPLSPCVSDNNSGREREFEFWFNLAEYIRFKDQPQYREAQELVLANMRRLLDGRENRDILYSIAILREHGPKYEPGYEKVLPDHLDESEDRFKLAVASRFLRNQAKPEVGLTNVGRRLCEVAVMAYVEPGVNIRRKKA
jgi:hypothetical protein